MKLKEKHPGKLFVLSGPSGAGKGTICKRLLEETEDLSLSVSMTTRQPRTGEIDGVSYFFTDVETFENHIAGGELLEFAKVYGNYYGTPKRAVLEKLARGTDVILEIDMQGALKVKENYPDGVFIFILPPSMSELRKRLTAAAPSRPKPSNCGSAKPSRSFRISKNMITAWSTAYWRKLWHGSRPS